MNLRRAPPLNQRKGVSAFQHVLGIQSAGRRHNVRLKTRPSARRRKGGGWNGGSEGGFVVAWLMLLRISYLEGWFSLGDESWICRTI